MHQSPCSTKTPVHHPVLRNRRYTACSQSFHQHPRCGSFSSCMSLQQQRPDQPPSSPHKAGGLWECAPAALDHNVGCIVAGTHTLLYAFASNQLGQEPAHKGVTCSQPAAVSRQRSSSSQESAHVTCVVANACSAADTACAPPQCAALRRCAVLWCASNQFEANEATHIVRPSPLTTTTHLLRLCRPACPQAGQ